MDAILWMCRRLSGCHSYQDGSAPLKPASPGVLSMNMAMVTQPRSRQGHLLPRHHVLHSPLSTGTTQG